MSVSCLRSVEVCLRSACLEPECVRASVDGYVYVCECACVRNVSVSVSVSVYVRLHVLCILYATRMTIVRD